MKVSGGFINQPELYSPSVFSSTASCELQPLAISAAIKRFSFFTLFIVSIVIIFVVSSQRLDWLIVT